MRYILIELQLSNNGLKRKEMHCLSFVSQRSGMIRASLPEYKALELLSSLGEGRG